MRKHARFTATAIIVALGLALWTASGVIVTNADIVRPHSSALSIIGTGATPSSSWTRIHLDQRMNTFPHTGSQINVLNPNSRTLKILDLN
jgi:hypothetical protein